MFVHVMRNTSNDHAILRVEILQRLQEAKIRHSPLLAVAAVALILATSGPFIVALVAASCCRGGQHRHSRVRLCAAAVLFVTCVRVRAGAAAAAISIGASACEHGRVIARN